MTGNTAFLHPGSPLCFLFLQFTPPHHCFLIVNFYTLIGLVFARFIPPTLELLKSPICSSVPSLRRTPTGSSTHRFLLAWGTPKFAWKFNPERSSHSISVGHHPLRRAPALRWMVPAPAAAIPQHFLRSLRVLNKGLVIYVCLMT